MKKSFIVFLTALIFLVSIFVGFKVMENSSPKNEENYIELKASEKSPADILKRMTLEQKIGQMLIVRNDYNAMTPEYESELLEIKPGGYIIFDKNITTLSGTKQLISDIREKIENSASVIMEDGETLKIPAILSIDQEGGLVQRLQSISDSPPEYIAPMSEIGASGSTETAYKTGLLIAEECKSIGLNLDYAPVADIFSNPENTVIGNRAFGSDKETVAEMSISLSKGLRDSGVIPVFKHFPGHGDTVADSHISLPVVTKTLDELEENELYPFRKAIESGAEIIMVAHIALPNITEDYTPASLSPAVITDVLKNRLNYNGLVITDGLDMGALTENYSDSEIALKAVMAGADLLLTPTSPLEAKNALLSAVEDGTISEARINESVIKILELKFRLLK